MTERTDIDVVGKYHFSASVFHLAEAGNEDIVADPGTLRLFTAKTEENMVINQCIVTDKNSVRTAQGDMVTKDDISARCSEHCRIENFTQP